MYIDAKNANGTIYITERSDQGNLQIKTEKVSYVAYEEHPYGNLKSITGVRLREVPFSSKKQLLEYKNKHKLWESDVNPTFRYLEHAYPDDNKLPDLRISIFDIEVDRDQVRSYAPPNNPFCPIISFTIYEKWCKKAITIAVPPPNLSFEKALRLIEDPMHPDGYGYMGENEGYYLVPTEIDLLNAFADIIQDTDILTGWNSEFYDLPYIVNRARVIMGGENPDDIAVEQDFLPTDASREYLERLSVFKVLPDTSEVEAYGRRERSCNMR